MRVKVSPINCSGIRAKWDHLRLWIWEKLFLSLMNKAGMLLGKMDRRKQEWKHLFLIALLKYNLIEVSNNQFIHIEIEIIPNNLIKYSIV